MIEIKSLSNGLRIVMEEMPYVRSISLGIFVENGTRNEKPETNGISHFIEHMLFKGTENRSAKDIAEEMDAVGGQINAYTTKEYTCYHTRVLDKHFDRAIDVMADMLLHSKFAEDDIKRERNVIIEEISMYEDAPEELVHDSLQEEIWKGVSLGMPILGTEKSLNTFSRQTFLTYFAENYQPQNTVISVTGNFKEAEMYQKLESYFGAWRPKASYAHHDTKTIYHPTVIMNEKDIEQIHLCIAFPGFERDNPYKYALSVFNTIFGGGMSSLLFQKLREENGLTYSIYSYLSSYKDAGLFAIYAGMGSNQVNRVMELICQEIAEIKRNRISQALLEKTKEQLISNYIIGTESSVNRMTSMGGSVLLRNRIQTMEEVISRYEAVTRKDIDYVIDTIFQLDTISVSAVGSIQGLAPLDIIKAHWK